MNVMSNFSIVIDIKLQSYEIKLSPRAISGFLILEIFSAESRQQWNSVKAEFQPGKLKKAFLK